MHYTQMTEAELREGRSVFGPSSVYALELAERVTAPAVLGDEAWTYDMPQALCETHQSGLRWAHTVDGVQLTCGFRRMWWHDSAPEACVLTPAQTRVELVLHSVGLAYRVTE